MTITLKIILASAAVFGLTLAGFAFVIYESSETAEFGKLDARMESHANKLQTEVEEQKGEQQFPVQDAFAAIRTEGLPDVRFRLVDKQGRFVCGDSSLMSLPLEPWPERADSPVRLGFVTVNGRRERSLWMPIEVDDRLEFASQLVSPMTEMDENLGRLRLLFLVMGPVAFFLVSGAIVLITRTAFRPISSMAETARSITAARLDKRLEVPGTRDEVRALAETLNGMMERVDAAFRAQRQFVADASHEIRTPLTIIRTELEFAERNVGKPEAEESIGIALKEVERLSRLAEGLLTLARLDAPGFSLSLVPVRIDELLAECVRHLSRAASEKHVTLEIRIEEAVELQADRNQLKGVVLNILDNAIHYSKEGGTVQISMSASSTGSASIVVEDHGTGIDPLDVPHIFKRFFRADADRSREGGAGLGLAIADQVVRLHGGTIRVESTPSEGSLFAVTLPLRGSDHADQTRRP